MKKLLYITDQEEYSEHGTIKSLFHGYLKAYMGVNVVYFTKYKHSFQIKGDDFIVPDHYSKDIVAYLQRHDVDMAQYDYVFVRNVSHILGTILKYRYQYHYKVGFRTSFAKTTLAYEEAQMQGAGFFKKWRLRVGNAAKDRLISQVDIFMPTSTQMQRVFYPNVTCKIYPLLTALDPQTISVRPVRHDGIRRFIYVGSLDRLREFEVVLDAFNAIHDLPWHLSMVVHDPEVIQQLVKIYPKIKNRIEILYTDELHRIYEEIQKCDVGLGLLPNRELYNNALSAKVVDYYANAVPALLSINEKNRSIFDEESEAYFSAFETKPITLQLKKLIETDEEILIEAGKKGQQKLLDLERDYRVMAKKLFDELENL
jgi:hypothetical protein